MEANDEIGISQELAEAANAYRDMILREGNNLFKMEGKQSIANRVTVVLAAQVDAIASEILSATLTGTQDQDKIFRDLLEGTLTAIRGTAIERYKNYRDSIQ